MHSIHSVKPRAKHAGPPLVTNIHRKVFGTADSACCETLHHWHCVARFHYHKSIQMWGQTSESSQLQDYAKSTALLLGIHTHSRQLDTSNPRHWPLACCFTARYTVSAACLSAAIAGDKATGLPNRKYIRAGAVGATSGGMKLWPRARQSGTIELLLGRRQISTQSQAAAPL
jgi:hypothetical protein